MLVNVTATRAEAYMEGWRTYVSLETFAIAPAATDVEALKREVMREIREQGPIPTTILRILTLIAGRYDNCGEVYSIRCDVDYGTTLGLYSSRSYYVKVARIAGIVSLRNMADPVSLE